MSTPAQNRLDDLLYDNHRRKLDFSESLELCWLALVVTIQRRWRRRFS